MTSVDAPTLAAVEVIIDSTLWAAEGSAESIVRRAIAAAAKETRTESGEVAVVLTDDAAIRALNHKWRKLDKPTNVLSFPAPKAMAPLGTAPLGDIVIAFETTAGEAAAEGKPLRDHLTHLAVHGFLHLLGYDHESDGDAREMEDLEANILAGLDVPNPYLT